VQSNAGRSSPRRIGEGNQVFEVSVVERLDDLPQEFRELSVRKNLSVAV
jgi:hypothetical protein